MEATPCFSDLDLHRLQLNIPEYYMKLLTAWDDLHRDNSEVSILAKGTWYNKNIKFGGKSIFFDEFARKGIVIIADHYN